VILTEEIICAPMLLSIIFPGELPDRRRRPRLRLAYSVRLKRRGDAARIETKTEDVSCEGFLCLTEQLFSPREILDCELIIPGESYGRAADDAIVLHCTAEVVRVVPQANNAVFRIACRVADYTIGQYVEQPNALPQGISLEQLV